MNKQTWKEKKERIQGKLLHLNICSTTLVVTGHKETALGAPHTTFSWSFVFLCPAGHLLLRCVITQTPASQTAAHPSPCSLHFKRFRILQAGTLSSCQALRRSPAHLSQMIKVRYQKEKPFLKVSHK